VNGTLSFKHRAGVLIAVSLAATVVVFVLPAIPQDPSYHNFADQRASWGIPNFWNVASNLPFLLVGFAGLQAFVGRPPRGSLESLRPAYLTFFAGIALIAPGSAYYHWSPDNGSRAWDRLPMTVAFMAFAAIIIGEYISETAGRRALWPLVLMGIVSVFYWTVPESLGRGDLRPYGLVQFLPMLVIPSIMLMFRSTFTGSLYIWGMLAAYLDAKLADHFDEHIFRMLAPISGHSLKHLVSALGAYSFLCAVRRRQLRGQFHE